jgi:hypothetical protein
MLASCFQQCADDFFEGAHGAEYSAAIRSMTVDSRARRSVSFISNGGIPTAWRSTPESRHEAAVKSSARLASAADGTTISLSPEVCMATLKRQKSQLSKSARRRIHEIQLVAEEQRVTGEDQRTSAEEERQRAETVRVSRELRREATEQRRASSEDQLQSNEDARIAAEVLRAAAEDIRKAAELSRDTAESARQAVGAAVTLLDEVKQLLRELREAK